METPDIDLVRAAPPVSEMRADGVFGMPTMIVRFSTFNTWYKVDSWFEGTFLERTVPGAFTKTIKEDRAAIKVLYDHGFDGQIGNKVLGPIDDLREDPDSPVGEVPLFDTSYNRDLVPGLDAGVYGSSFRFRVTGEEWNDEPGTSETNPQGLPERTIKEVRLAEFGPVTFPANPDSTSGLRSLTDSYYERLQKREPQLYDAAVRAASRINPLNFTGRPSAWSAGGGDDDTKSGNDDVSAFRIDDPSTRDRVLRALGAI